MASRTGQSEPDRPLIIFATEGEARPARPPIASLALNPLLPTAIRLQDAKRIDTRHRAAPMRGRAGHAGPIEPLYWTINGARGRLSSGKPLFSVKRGAPVTLALVNRSSVVQQIHVHGHAMRLLHDLDDGWEPYWRDTVLVAPRENQACRLHRRQSGQMGHRIPHRRPAGDRARHLVRGDLNRFPLLDLKRPARSQAFAGFLHKARPKERRMSSTLTLVSDSAAGQHFELTLEKTADDAGLELDRKVMNVIDSHSSERDAGGKVDPLFLIPLW